MWSKWLALCAFVVLASGLPTGAAFLDQNAQPQDVQKPIDNQQRSAAAAAEPASRFVTVAADGTISLTASNAPLEAVLTQIAEKTRIPIMLSDALQHARVSVTVRGLPFEDGLKRLLEDYDTFYLFGARDKKPASIKAIWIYAKGEGEALEPVPPSLWASTKDLKAQVDDPDLAVRTEAMETLIQRLGDKGLPIVMKGLADGDEVVRLATLSAAADADIEIPAADLHSLVLTDQSPHVRFAALRAVEGRPEAEAIASSVKNDPDDAIRNQALAMLGEVQSGLAKQRPK